MPDPCCFEYRSLKDEPDTTTNNCGNDQNRDNTGTSLVSCGQRIELDDWCSVDIVASIWVTLRSTASSGTLGCCIGIHLCSPNDG